MGYTVSVSFIEFLRKFCVYENTMLGKRVIKFEKLGQNFTCR